MVCRPVTMRALPNMTTVGFTGSGRPMTETHARTRYDHKADAEKDEEFKESAPQARQRLEFKPDPPTRKRF
jgi:hypothetical protein